MSKPSDIPAKPQRWPFKFSREWITRPVFAVLLASAMIWVIFADKPFLEIGAGAFAVLGAREWHRMVGKGRFIAEMALTTATIWIALAVFLWSPSLPTLGLILAAGTLIVFVAGLIRRNHPVWHAGGVVYFGLPALSIIALRDFTVQGEWVLIGLFLIIWAADTGAMICGKLIGGPKLAPVLSPNKTWAGAIGGILAAAVVEAVFIRIGHGNAALGALFGAGVGVIAHLGDLFESWVKRCFHVKDSGSMIPGHGGVLDRIDSTLATLVAVAVLVFVIGLEPLFGAKL